MRRLRFAAALALLAGTCHARDVTILRDRWGVPHIHGRTDADAAFGLAYAHCEDHWPDIYRSLVAARGRLSESVRSKKALANDYFVALFGVAQEVERSYGTELSSGTRAVLEGYAEGMTVYARRHPEEAAGQRLPFTGKDVAAAFVHRLPLMMDVGRTISAVRAGTLTPEAFAGPGSNAHAISGFRSPDGVTRLNSNSHQPWEGPVAWYEAHVASDEGLDMHGATFAGSPFILLGHNGRLGWTHTVNRPDVVDVYRLTLDATGHKYLFDGRWRDLSESRADIKVRWGPFSWTFHPKLARSVHGPVLKTKAGAFAVRVAGQGRLLRAAEQWYRMGRAKDFSEWTAAMRLQGITMFNTVYADSGTIHYVYNALLPRRAPGLPWDGVVPGDTSATLWTDYVSYDELPQVTNPASGFVQSCNNSPFLTTTGPGNPDPGRYKDMVGIDRRVTNRALRSLALFSDPAPIDRERFYAYKYDRAYAKDSPLYREAVAEVLAGYSPKGETERRGLDILRRWDARAEADSRDAALPVLTMRPISAARELGRGEDPGGPAAFSAAVLFLQRHYGRLDVPLGEVQRLRRGRLDLPLAGGPDALNAVYGRLEKGALVAETGDSFFMLVEFHPDGRVESYSVQPYGASGRPESAHYNDQSLDFAERRLHKEPETAEELHAGAFREYQPGEEK